MGASPRSVRSSRRSAAGQNQQVYRYVDKDGRVVYSDRGPPSDAKDVQAKRMRGNVIEDNATPIAAQQAQERFPVTLYSFSCGEVCTQAEGLLNRRGVPFTTVNVETPEGAEQLTKMTGELRAPVLQVGDRTFVKGYSESQWNSGARRRRLPEGAAAAPHGSRTRPYDGIGFGRRRRRRCTQRAARRQRACALSAAVAAIAARRGPPREARWGSEQMRSSQAADPRYNDVIWRCGGRAAIAARRGPPAKRVGGVRSSQAADPD